MFLAWEFVEGGLLGSVSPHLFILSLSESAHSVLFNKLLSAPLCTRNCDGTYCLFPPHCTLTYPYMHTHTLRAKVSEFKHQISKGKNKKRTGGNHPSEHCVCKPPPPHSPSHQKTNPEYPDVCNWPPCSLLRPAADSASQIGGLSIIGARTRLSLWHPHILTSLGVCSARD